MTRSCINAGLAQVTTRLTADLRAWDLPVLPVLNLPVLPVLNLPGLPVLNPPVLNLPDLPVLGLPPAAGPGQTRAPAGPQPASYGRIAPGTAEPYGAALGPVATSRSTGDTARADGQGRPVPASPPPPPGPAPEHGLLPPGAGAAAAGWSLAAAAAGLLWLASLGSGRRRSPVDRRVPASRVLRPIPRPA